MKVKTLSNFGYFYTILNNFLFNICKTLFKSFPCLIICPFIAMTEYMPPRFESFGVFTIMYNGVSVERLNTEKMALEKEEDIL